METIRFRLKGERPLIVHSDRFVNPLDPLTQRHKALTAKRKKTDDDHREIARSEWLGGLYHDPKLGPYMPGQNIERMLLDAAKLQKLGTATKRAVSVEEDKAPIEYDGPRDPDKMFKDARFVDIRSVKVQQSRLMRCRPIFQEWEIEFSVWYDPSVLDRRQIESIVQDAGRMIGMGDYRPRFGQFVAEVVK